MAITSCVNNVPLVGKYMWGVHYVNIISDSYFKQHVYGLVQERNNFSALAIELCFSCINPSM